MSKHAYLIMAHKDMNQLERLIKTLDYPLNDIYLHVDIKAKHVDLDYLKNRVKYSNVQFLERKNVIWGSESQIECELNLMETALSGGIYSYFHLLSESDLPIRSQKEIHLFFDQNSGREFIHYESNHLEGENKEKLLRFYPFQKFVGSKKNSLYYAQRLLVKVQKIFNIHRNINIQQFAKGANWFSITPDLAKYILGKKEWIRKTFKYTLCCDEIFLQSIVINSPYKDKLFWKGFDNDYKANLREIFWEKGKGNPRYITNQDFESLYNSDKMFARKFNMQFSEKLLNTLLEKR